MERESNITIEIALNKIESILVRHSDKGMIHSSLDFLIQEMEHIFYEDWQKEE